MQPCELLDDSEHNPAEETLGIVQKEHIQEIEKYIEKCKQSYFGQCSADEVKETHWYYENLYPVIGGYYIVQSLSTKTLFHRMHNDHFLPLIAVHTIKIENMKATALQTISKVKLEYVEAIDKQKYGHHGNQLRKFCISLNITKNKPLNNF